MSTNNNTPAEVFPPGEFIRDELEARGWTQADLAEILGKSARLINEVIAGKRGITPETAKGLAEAFETSAELWLGLESDYRLSQTSAPDNAIARRAKLYEKAPVSEMIRRGWIEPSKNIETLEHQVIKFFGLRTIEDEPRLGVAARAKLSNGAAYSPAQLAWFFRARQLAQAVSVGRFSRKSLDGALSKLRVLLADPGNVRHVPRVLADAGIRFLIVEHTSGSHIDGAALWLDDDSPIVALSVRYDRIDSFWHTLLHELGHISAGDGQALDVDIVGPEADRDAWSDVERKADQFAVEFLVPQAALDDFVARVHPIYSRQKIEAFATLHHIHPALVLGQLKHKRGREVIPWRNMANLHVRVRDLIIEAALCDGWGHAPPLWRTE